MEYNFSDVMETFERMCSKYNYACDVDECPICRLIDIWEKQNDNTWDRDCVYFGEKYPEDFARTVMLWGANNEPDIYPTVREVMSKICSLMKNNLTVKMEDCLDERLAPEVARMFNIEPINKNKLV